MKLVGIQKIWEIGKTPVVTIPKEAREQIKLLKPGNYVEVYIEGDKLIIKPIDLSEYRKKVEESIKSVIDHASRREKI